MTTGTRIAIIEADTPLPQVQKRLGSYGDIFTALLKKAGLVDSANISSYNVVNDSSNYPPIESIDAILISGSKHNAFEDDEWILRLVEFTKQAIEHNKRVIGICFGHQIVARALGCTVARSPLGWEVSAVPIELTAEGRALFGTEQAPKTSLSIMQMHRDIVDGVPENTTVLATTQKCGNQGFYRPHAILTLQGHPEFTQTIVEELVQARVELLGQELHDDALKRAQDHNDGPFIARVMVDFVEGRI